MHEMALSISLVDLIGDQKKANGFNSVKRVVVEIGALGHVDGHALRFSFDAAAHGTIAEGAMLEILELPGRAWCMDCAKTVDLAERGAPCPSCGGAHLVVEQGEDLRLKELEVV